MAGGGDGNNDGGKKSETTSSKLIDGSSPFFLHASENPGTMISSCVLKGDNYDLWQKAMRNALRAKNKLGFIDGSVMQPADAGAPEASLWGPCNSMLVSWLFNSIDPALQPSIAYAETVKELWDDLKERFAIGNATRIHQLKADIAAARQQGQSVVAYYTRLKGMWDELSNYLKVPMCTCHGCTCNMAKDLLKEREDEKTHQFLMGLDDSVFKNVRSHILSMDPLPSLNKVYSLVIQEERHRSIARGKEEMTDAVGFVVQASKPRERPVCSHCSKIGHEKAQCYELIGYPEGWGRGGRGGRGGRSGGRGGRGRGHAYATAVTSAGAGASASGAGASSAGAGASGEKESHVSVPGLSDAQVQQIIAIIAKSNAGASNEKLNGKIQELDWILDSGASHHMTGDFACLQNVCAVNPTTVGLPNGEQTVAKHEGDVVLSEGFVLERDHSTRTLIGVGEQKDGVYYYHRGASGRVFHNGRVERKHRHILNVARALRFQANLPLEFWGECVLSAAYLINRTPTQVLSNKTPYEVLFGKPPSYAAVRNFGCLCYIKSRTSDKFESRSRKCAFVGYPYGKKGWKVFDLETQEFIISRDVVFCEDVYPFSNMASESAPASGLSGQNAPRVGQSDDASFIQLATHRRTVDEHLLDDELVEARGSAHVFDDSESTDNQSASTSGQSAPASGPSAPASFGESAPASFGESAPTSGPSAPASSGESAPPSGPSAPVSSGESALASGPSASASSQSAPRRSRHPPARLQDYICYTAKCDPSCAHPTSTAASGTPYPIAHYVNCDKFSAAHRQFLAAVTAKKEPEHFGEAMKDSNWRKAMQTEIEALEHNNTWSIEDLPSNKKAIGCKWVYRIKYNSDGSVERYKARLVVLGNRQVEGIDFKETFAPVAKMVSVRTFLAVAVARGWELHQMDVHNAFLHGDLHEEVYMRLPPGFASKHPGKVCRLRKSLYGLRQAPRMWFSKLTEALKAYGFTQSYADYSLFTLEKHDTFLAILVYVDDLVIAGNNSDAIVRFKQYLSSTFHMKDLGALKYFLGIEIARNSTGLYLCQRKYTLDIVAECGLLGGKPVAFPIEQNHNLSTASGKLMKDPERYRRLVGRLIYLTITRPDLCYSVHILAQFMHAPLDVHYDAAIRVMRYLKGSPGQGILLRAESDLTLYGYCDSDWATCPLTRRSLTGYFVMLGGSPISWKTKKQHTVSRSSAEAEYRSMATTSCELIWLKTLLTSLGISHTQPMKLMCDSQAALHIAANPVFHERTKHIEIDCHYVRDQIQAGCIVASHIRTNEQLADIFTKALGKRQFHYLLGKLGIRNLHAPLEGEYYGKIS
ncbi:hypothetical protein LUZ61_013530 [Rhynchospora tenuis]|uniref:Polyprotein n=1 Tax=Rhynchospora tenuis TaxID=198213 RepID=A0AAD5Z2Q8_9POAL|nr:hypothetical protein LUZ61_013530 [Rhynchospora tenuis]